VFTLWGNGTPEEKWWTGRIELATRDFQSARDDEDPVSPYPLQSFESVKKVYDDFAVASERELDVW
jgi:hypothetical protein